MIRIISSKSKLVKGVPRRVHLSQKVLAWEFKAVCDNGKEKQSPGQTESENFVSTYLQAAINKAENRCRKLFEQTPYAIMGPLENDGDMAPLVKLRAPTGAWREGDEDMPGDPIGYVVREGAKQYKFVTLTGREVDEPEPPLHQIRP